MKPESEPIILFACGYCFFFTTSFFVALGGFTGKTGTSLRRRGTANVATANCRGRLASPDELPEDLEPTVIGVIVTNFGLGTRSLGDLLVPDGGFLVGESVLELDGVGSVSIEVQSLSSSVTVQIEIEHYCCVDDDGTYNL